MSRSVFGATTIFVAGPAIALMADVAAVVTPAALAVTVTAPAMAPRVTCVDARPEASLVAEAGETVALPVVVNVIATPETASPAASTTLTAKVPADAPTGAVAVGSVAMLTRAAGPTLGPAGSEPPQPAVARSDAP